MKRVLAALPLLAATACGGDGGHAAHDPAPAGTPGGRVVAISATDALRFDPATVTAKAGETVTFRVTNAGKASHEFVIGDDEFHAEHSEAMGSSSAHGGHDERGTSAALPPGATTDVTFTMPDEAPRFACYVDGHATAGMKGSVTYG